MPLAALDFEDESDPHSVLRQSTQLKQNINAKINKNFLMIKK